MICHWYKLKAKTSKFIITTIHYSDVERPSWAISFVESLLTFINEDSSFTVSTAVSKAPSNVVGCVKWYPSLIYIYCLEILN